MTRAGALGAASLALGALGEGCQAPPARRPPALVVTAPPSAPAVASSAPPAIVAEAPPSANAARWHWSLTTLPAEPTRDAPVLRFSSDDDQILVNWGTKLTLRIDDGAYVGAGCEVTSGGRRGALCVDDVGPFRPAQVEADDVTALLHTEIIEVHGPRGHGAEGYLTTLELQAGKAKRKRTFRADHFQGVYAFGPVAGRTPRWLVLHEAHFGEVRLVNFDLRGDKVIAKDVFAVTARRDGSLAFERQDGLDVWAARDGKPARVDSVTWGDRVSVASSHSGALVAFVNYPPPKAGDVPVYVQPLDGSAPPRAVAHLPSPKGPVATARWENAPGSKSWPHRARFLGVEAEVKEAQRPDGRKYGRGQGMCCNLPLHPACPAEWSEKDLAFCFDDEAAPAIVPGADVRLRCAQFGAGEPSPGPPWPQCLPAR